MAVRAAALAGTVLALVTACTPDRSDQPLPPPGGPDAPVPATATVRTPAPNDSAAAVPDADATRTVSPAQGTVELAVRGARPAGEAGAVRDAYVGWVRAYLTAYARPGADDGAVRRYATPAVAGEVRRRVEALVLRGWAEYGGAVLTGVTARPSGPAAAVTACLDLSRLATRDAAGRLARRDRPVRSTASLVRSGGHWLVAADRKSPTRSCP